MQDPQPEFQPLPGKAEPLAPGLLRVLASNASPMTFRGTNTYLLGTREVAVIDPGPMDEAHLEAILAALPKGGQITQILVTHAHLDHAPLAAVLSDRVGVPVSGFGGAHAGRSEVMQALARSGSVGGGEGVDLAFSPDVILSDGDVVKGDGWQLEALHTPGHMANHLSFAWGDVLFSGDLVMGWATSLVSPPDGDLTAFMDSLRRLQNRSWSIFHPGHGAPVGMPARRLSDLIAHRKGRESSIVRALDDGPATAAQLAARIYVDTPKALLPAAARNVLAHLIDLTVRSVVAPVSDLNANAQFQRNSAG